MSSLDVERRLTEVLHRHAEDAMSKTDTQQQLQELLSREDHEPPRFRRRAAVVGAGLAAAAVATAVLWASGLSEDGAEPAPAQRPAPDPVQIAEEFVAAYTTNDTETVTAMAADLADVDGWRVSMARNEAWSARFLTEPCTEQFTWSSGTEVSCPFSLHAMHSAELGRGPFENAYFSVLVTEDGKVLDADPTWNFENNGLEQHFDAVTSWVFETYPEDRRLLERDEQELSPAQLGRYLTLWERYLQEYLDAHS